MTIVELREKRAKLWATMEGFLDTHRNDKGVLSTEDDAVYANMEKELNDLTNEVRRMERRDAIAAELAKPVSSPITEQPQKATGEAKTGRASGAYREDFGLHLRGKRMLHNVLSEGVDANGGYLVPTEFEKFIVDTLKEENVMRRLCKIITTDNERKIPVAATHSTAAWTAENAAYTESNPTFVFEGTPADGMVQLLSGTPFSVGVIEAAGRVECAFTDQSPLSRRSALMRFINACGCEVEYDGYKINLRRHRGSTVRKSLMDGENVTDLAVTVDSRENTQSYEISLFKMADLQAGDEVNITYTPMGVNVDTRIISIEYDPFYRYTVRVEVGDYVPNLMASTATQLDRVRQEFKAADGKLISSIQTVDGNLSTLSQTVSGFNTRIENAEGAVSTLSQAVGGFNTRIENAEGSVSTLTQTVNSFKTRIETVEGNITSVTQTANKINWLVKSGTSASDFTMTDRAVKLVADTIDLSGYVTISALGTAGKTTINGANITTGTIHADRIDTSTLKVKTIYSQSGKVSLKEYTSTTMYIGGDGTWNYDYTYIFAGTQIKLASWDGVGTHALIVETTNHCIRPATIVDWDLGNASYPFGNLWCENIQIRSGSNTVARFGFNSGTFECLFSGAAVNRLGSSTYYWDTGYIEKLYLSSNCYLSASAGKLCVNGTAIGGGSDPNMAGAEVKMGGSTSYYITANTSRELKPSSSSTSYPFYLGTASLYWHYAYLGSVQVKIGSSNSSRIGFFSTSPIARQTLSTYSQNMGYSSASSSNYLKILNNLVGILVKYGLIGT